LLPLFSSHTGEHRMNRFAAAALCLALAGPAYAQSLGEKTGVNSLLGISPKTEDFVKEAASSDMFEMQSSKLAVERATDDRVKTYAQQMIADHEKTSTEMKSMVQAANLKVEIPTAMLPTHQKMMDKLTGLNGADFTKQYVDDQVTAHKEAVNLFERYGKGGEDEQLKNWASKTLPSLQHHHHMAQELDKASDKKS
jgi:putative membrane protein